MAKKNVEDEKHFLLESPRYTQIRSQIPNICHKTDLPNLAVSGINIDFLFVVFRFVLKSLFDITLLHRDIIDARRFCQHCGLVKQGIFSSFYL
jgi:hypothetical protein